MPPTTDTTTQAAELLAALLNAKSAASDAQVRLARTSALDRAAFDAQRSATTDAEADFYRAFHAVCLAAGLVPGDVVDLAHDRAETSA